MKTYNRDYFFLDEEKIMQAIKTVCKNKSKNHKNYKYEQAQHILQNIEKYVFKIKDIVLKTKEKYFLEKIGERVPQNILLGAFKARKCKSFKINEHSSNKTRIITSAPLFPDQIIHELAIMVFKDTVLKEFYHHSYASIPGKGLHLAAKYIRKIIRKNNNSSNIKYICKIDIKKCYPSINHLIVKEKINKKFRGFLFKNILFNILDSYSETENEQGGKTGIAIGYSTSQWICNFLLTDVDNYIKHVLKARYYIRYMDDMVAFGKNKRELHKKLKLLRVFLYKLKLRVKGNWQIFKFDYTKNGKTTGRLLDFLGFKFYRNKIVLRRSIFLKIKRQAKKIYKLKHKYASICRSFMSRIGWLKHCNSLTMYHKYVKKYVNIKKIKGVISYEDTINRQTNFTI